MITIISGTNRPRSNSLKLAKYYQKRLEDKGEASTILDLADLPGAFITAEMYGKTSPDFRGFQECVTASEKFLFIIPEYNGSFPGILKTFIDACKFPDSFFGKKAALVGHSTGRYGNVRGLDHFTGVCHYIRLHVLSLRIHIPHITSEFNADGHLFKPDTLRFTEEQIDEFVKF